MGGKSDIVTAKVPCALVGISAEAHVMMSYHVFRYADVVKGPCASAVSFKGINIVKFVTKNDGGDDL